jgi:hypothetical protein
MVGKRLTIEEVGMMFCSAMSGRIRGMGGDPGRGRRRGIIFTEEGRDGDS